MFITRRPSRSELNLLGKLLRNARDVQGYTQEMVAETLGCSVHWVSDIERGKSHPNWRDVIHYAMIVKLDLTLFIEEAGLNVLVSSR